MSRSTKGYLCWRTMATGEFESGLWTSHDACNDSNTHADGARRYWIKGCDCDDCELNRGANEG